jgi:hypothetical protein
MPSDVYLLPCSFFFTLGMLSILWPEVLREFAWSQHRRRTVRGLAKAQVVVGLFCWAAHDYCHMEGVVTPFSLLLIAGGLLVILTPSVGLWSLRAVVLARASRIRMLGLALVLFSGFLLMAARPNPPSHFSMESLATVDSSVWQG